MCVDPAGTDTGVWGSGKGDVVVILHANKHSECKKIPRSGIHLLYEPSRGWSVAVTVAMDVDLAVDVAVAMDVDVGVVGVGVGVGVVGVVGMVVGICMVMWTWAWARGGRKMGGKEERFKLNRQRVMRHGSNFKVQL